MTLTAKSTNEKIECSYDSDYDRDTFTLTLPSGKFGFITIRVNKYDLEDLISTLKNFDEAMRATGQIRGLE